MKSLEEIRKEIYSILNKEGIGFDKVKKLGIGKLLKQLSNINKQPESKPTKLKLKNKTEPDIRVWRAGED